ncbi:MAG: PaaI family thioesterase [Planctomycetota bacterium]|nr:PaaI family thioesterase [Planctomycetota bacterium]
MNEPKSLQATHGPNGHCFGCGPKNDKGLRLESHVDGDAVVCRWQARPEHQAWKGTINGGVIGALFDCHSNWTAAWHLWEQGGRGEFPSTVTAEFHVKLKRPTSSRTPVTIRARVAESSENRATIEATMESEGKLTATCRGTFVAIPPGHPAYHRWS